ncbi:hypothetical protein ABFV62_31395, partial [Pseudomonas syringae]|uniref:hypothetical protein n=1 Tax=Pseudomonas syringae TaxID=317 RepID=UPI0034D71247
FLVGVVGCGVGLVCCFWGAWVLFLPVGYAMVGGGFLLGVLAIVFGFTLFIVYYIVLGFFWGFWACFFNECCMLLRQPQC